MLNQKHVNENLKSQVIFIDTPGIFSAKRRLDKAMVSAAWSEVKYSEKIIFLHDVSKNNSHKNSLHISSSFNTEEISKNSKGQVELYKSTINVNLQIKNINNQIIQKRNFAKEFRYNNKQNKFDLAQYQSSIKDDLINKIVSDTIIFLNSE